MPARGPRRELWSWARIQVSEGGAQVVWALMCLPLCLAWQMGVDIQRVKLAPVAQVQIPALPFPHPCPGGTAPDLGVPICKMR